MRYARTRACSSLLVVTNIPIPTAVNTASLCLPFKPITDSVGLTATTHFLTRPFADLLLLDTCIGGSTATSRYRRSALLNNEDDSAESDSATSKQTDTCDEKRSLFCKNELVIRQQLCSS